jgi:hypothetical protein
MNTTLLDAPRPRQSQLPFFPASFPDETLLSRVSRYHLLSARRDDQDTFAELFGEPGEMTKFARAAPQTLSRLARMLPGAYLARLGELLSANTFVPLLASISLSPDVEFGEANACAICLAEDEEEHGAPYLHRSHQLPSVIACWKHGTVLLQACPHCDSRFKIPGKLIRAPIIPCSCGLTYQWQGVQASPGERTFASHAHRVLSARTRRSNTSLLIEFFQREMECSEFATDTTTSTVNRQLLIGMITAELITGRSSLEIAIAASQVLKSTDPWVWWLGDRFPSW